MAFWHNMFGGGDQTDDSVEQIKQNLNDGSAVLLDVRGHVERQQLAIKDSVFIPITEIQNLPAGTSVLPDLPKEKIVYCH